LWSFISQISKFDSDWASDPTDIRSTYAFSVFLRKNIISLMAKKQKVVSRSSTEAEFQSFATVITEGMYIQNLLKELRVTCSRPPLVWCDNQGAVLLSANQFYTQRVNTSSLICGL
jgi:hypothetical protein